MSERLSVSFVDRDSNRQIGALDRLPTTCPQCHHKIEPLKFQGFYSWNRRYTEQALEVVFWCPSADCAQVFIADYSQQGDRNNFYFKQTRPAKYETRVFSATISTISIEFQTIYNQALVAENAGLDQICGTGYRKALEFLVKDYLIGKVSDVAEKESIRNEYLGTAIRSRIKDANIKEVAKRAAWLGNDETHYIRKWATTDLQDLKKLIDLTVHWMEAESLTEQLLIDMPE